MFAFGDICMFAYVSVLWYHITPRMFHQAQPSMGEFFDIVEHNRGLREPVCKKMFLDVLQGVYALKMGESWKNNGSMAFALMRIFRGVLYVTQTKIPNTILNFSTNTCTKKRR